MPEIPLLGDRSARDSLGYPELHSKDLGDHTPRQHMPEEPEDGESPMWSGELSMWIARPINAILRYRQNDFQGYYSADDAGFAECLAACSPGDKLYLPFCVLLDDYTIDVDLWIFGTNNEFTTFRGTLTLQANVIFYHCLISKYYSTELCDTIKMDTGCATLALYNSQLYTNNIDGSIGIEMAVDGQALYMYNSMIYSLGDGHGIEVTSTNPETCFAELTYVILNCVYAYNPDQFEHFYTTNCWFAPGINTIGVPGSVREGHQILDDGTAKAQRSNLNLIGFTLTDHADTDTLDIEASDDEEDAADVTYTPGDATDWNGDADPGNVDGALNQLADRVVTLEEAPAPDASDVTYTPGVAADWNGDADPGNTDDALDQLAARVTDIEEETPTLEVRLEESNSVEIEITDQFVAITGNDAPQVTLPDVAEASGKVFIIKRMDDILDWMTISPDSETVHIDGQDGISLLTQYECVTLISDGTNWHIIGRYIP